MQIRATGLRAPTPHAGLRISHACTHAQVALANDGRVYVSDGYCNSRVLEFSAAGEYRGEFFLPKGAMRIPHSVVLQARTTSMHAGHGSACWCMGVYSCSASPRGIAASALVSVTRHAPLNGYGV